MEAAIARTAAPKQEWGWGRQCPNVSVLPPSDLLPLFPFVQNQPEAGGQGSLDNAVCYGSVILQRAGKIRVESSSGEQMWIATIVDVFFSSLRLLAGAKA